MTIRTRITTPEYRTGADAVDWQKAEPTSASGLAWTCRRCGETVPDGIRHCPLCGDTRLRLGPTRPPEFVMIDPPPMRFTCG